MSAAGIFFVALAAFVTPDGLTPAPASSSIERPAGALDEARLDERISLQLKDANLRQVLELLGELLGAVPVIEPSSVGDAVVTIDTRGTPVSEVIRQLETSHGLSIRLEGKRLLVGKSSAAPQARVPADDAVWDRELLSDLSLPRRPLSQKPPLSPAALSFRTAAGFIAVRLPKAGEATVRLPGCATPLTFSVLGNDPFDGALQLVVRDGARDGLPRIVRVAASGEPTALRKEGCEPFVSAGSPAGASEPESVRAYGDPVVLHVKAIEARADGTEGVFSVPSIRTLADMAASVQTGFSGASSATALHLQTLVLDVSGDTTVVSLAATLLRTITPSGEAEPVVVRVAHLDHSLRLRAAVPARLTASSTYGRGRSALVLEITLEKPAKR